MTGLGYFLVWLGLVSLGWLAMAEYGKRKSLERRFQAYAWGAAAEGTKLERPYKLPHVGKERRVS